MPEPVDAYRYFAFLRSRLRFVAISCVVAVSLAFAVSLAQPKIYTATCRILIEPPAGSDPRNAMAVSPVYLELLKTYVQFASNDSLFLRALDRFHLRARYPGRPVEALKASLLKVAMIPDTKIMEIKASLPDPKTAQELALFLGQETVRLSGSVADEGDRELAQSIEKQEAEGRSRVEQAEAAWSQMLAAQPVNRLEQDVQNQGEIKSSLERQLLRAQADENSALAGTLQKQLEQMDRDLAAKEDLLSKRLASRDRLESELTASRTAYNAIQSRLEQAHGELGYRGERLRIIDPGIVPEQPTSPNIPLRIFAALLLGLVAPLIYLTLQVGFENHRGSARRGALRVAGAARDE